MKKIIIPLIIFAAAMIATGLAKKSQERDLPASTGMSRAQSDQLYVEVVLNGAVDYYYDHKLGLDKVAQDLGVKTAFVGPPDYDVPAMITAFKQTLARENLKGIMIMGLEPALEAMINDAVDDGVPVICIDSDLPNSKRLAFVGTGNYAAGLLGGQKLAELIHYEGKVILMYAPAFTVQAERARGYRDVFAKYPKIEIVQVVDNQGDKTLAAQGCAAALQRYPDVAGIGCMGADDGPGAAVAVREANLAGKVKIVAMDRGNDVLGYIRDGLVDATIVQQSSLMTYYGTMLLYQMVNSPVAIASDNATAGVSGVPTYIDTGVTVVDKSNCDYFIR